VTLFAREGWFGGKTWEDAMAKGQLRGNREPKKPKKEKAKVMQAGSVSQTLETQSKGHPGKK
jgi:hypothetical protein